MPIKTECPNCRTSLSVPRKKVGTSIMCPRCDGEFRVLAEGLAITPAGVIFQPVGKPAHDSASEVYAAATAGGNTAKFITAGVAEPKVQLADDGKLPELHLIEDQQQAPADAASGKSNPLLLASALILSLALSIVLLFVDTDIPGGAAGGQARARKEIEKFFTADGDDLQPYQRELRSALQARARGDAKTEKAMYRKVLSRLRDERKNPFAGVTGSPQNDAELEKHLGVLLGQP